MAQFKDLPMEIVESIFSQLVIPDHDPWIDYVTRFPVADTKTLLSLTGTSRLCRSLAIQILFQSINEAQKAKYILNMFDANKYLAHFTKDLSLPFSPHSKSDHSDVQDIAARFGISDSVDHCIHEGRPETAEVSLTLALCSRLERLRIRLPDHCEANGWKNDSFSTTFNLFRIISCGLETVPFLENLKYLECFTGKHSDRGRLHGVPRLLQLTPKIEVLVLRSHWPKDYCLGLPFDVDVCRPALESLIEIQLLEWPLRKFLDNDLNVLERVVTATTRLTTFIYVNQGIAISSWDDEHPPQRLINTLLPAQSTLRHLTLNYGHRFLLPFDESRSNAEEIVIQPEQLKPFKHLETLEISQCVYCRHQFNREAEGATYLADLLPLTIRKLTIYAPRHHGAVKCMDCILHLGQRAITGEFPALEIVQINARFHQVRCRSFGIRNGGPGERPWTAEDAERETVRYGKALADAARAEEARKEKVIAAFAGSGVAVRYKAWQTVYVHKDFNVFDT